MAKKSNLQIWAEYVPVKLLLGGLGLLPRTVAVKLGISLARLFYIITGGRKDVALKNLEIAFPDKSVEERTGLLKASFENLGRTFGEFTQLHKATREQLDAIVEYKFLSPESYELAEREYLQTQYDSGRGVILIGPHLGNWEIGVLAYSATQHPIEYLARPLDNPKIENLVADIRSRFGNKPVNKNNSVGAAMEVLNSGGVLGALPDINVHPKDGVFVPFFGKLACTTRGLAMLAIRTNALIIPMCCVWDHAKQMYVAHYGSTFVEAAPGADRNAEILRMTAELTVQMEEFIRLAPDQWIWTHKRWKTRPLGEQPIY